MQVALTDGTVIEVEGGRSRVVSFPDPARSSLEARIATLEGQLAHLKAPEDEETE